MLNQGFEPSDSPEQQHTLRPEIEAGKDFPFGLERLGVGTWRSEFTQQFKNHYHSLDMSHPHSPPKANLEMYFIWEVIQGRISEETEKVRHGRRKVNRGHVKEQVAMVTGAQSCWVPSRKLNEIYSRILAISLPTPILSCLRVVLSGINFLHHPVISVYT